MARYIIVAVATVLALVAGTARGQYADWQVWDAQQVFNQLEEGTLYSQCPRVVSSGVFSRQDSTPQSDKVVLFADCTNGGAVVEREVGSYDVNQMGIRDNDLSQIVIPKGFKVTLYDEPRFRGRSLQLTETEDCLRFSNTDGIDGWNDATSSIKIERINPDRVILHSGCGYTGSNVALQPGSYDASDLNALGIGDNGLSSIIIPSGFQVQVFSEPGFRGDSLTFDSSVHCLGKNPHPWHYTWKDFISSLVISKGPHQVTLYSACMFSGTASYWGPGAYDMGSPEFVNDDASSISIPQGTTVHLYDGSGFTGRKMTLRGTSMCLDDQGWNDAVSSFRITDGKISWKDIWCYMESRGVNGDEGAAKVLTQKLDFDANERIDLQEFTDYFYGTFKSDDAFKAIDTNRDMQISFDELTQQQFQCCAHGSYDQARYEAVRLMNDIDANNDGVLYASEYRHASDWRVRYDM
jgi:Ca2+-binding EF-hand superfamily protein